VGGVRKAALELADERFRVALRRRRRNEREETRALLAQLALGAAGGDAEGAGANAQRAAPEGSGVAALLASTRS
jgi:hypothetical protein